MPDEERLTKLKLISLQKTSLRANLMEVAKILKKKRYKYSVGGPWATRPEAPAYSSVLRR